MVTALLAAALAAPAGTAPIVSPAALASRATKQTGAGIAGKIRWNVIRAGPLSSNVIAGTARRTSAATARRDRITLDRAAGNRAISIAAAGPCIPAITSPMRIAALRRLIAA